MDLLSAASGKRGVTREDLRGQRSGGPFLRCLTNASSVLLDVLKRFESLLIFRIDHEDFLEGFLGHFVVFALAVDLAEAQVGWDVLRFELECLLVVDLGVLQLFESAVGGTNVEVHLSVREVVLQTRGVAIDRVLVPRQHVERIAEVVVSLRVFRCQVNRFLEGDECNSVLSLQAKRVA